MTRRSPALTSGERTLGLRRTTVTTRLGRVVTRAARDVRTAGGAGKAGSKAATVLLHGGAGSWTTWTPLLTTAARRGIRVDDVIAIDLPGWGESGALPASADMGDLSAAVADVARALGYTTWHLAGHSLGGAVALDLAAREPEATLSVTLVSPSGAGAVDVARRPLRGGMRLPALAGMLLAMRVLAGLGAAGRMLLRTLHRTGALRALAAPLFAAPRGVHRSVTAALAEEIRPRAFVQAAQRAAAFDLERWRSVRCPVLSVRGARDVFAAPTDRAAFASRIPRFRETVLPSAGHFAHVECVDAVVATLAEARAVGDALAAQTARGRDAGRDAGRGPVESPLAERSLRAAATP